MKNLDRYILRSLFVNYLIAIAVMISLYVVLDLFFNMDEFTEDAQSTHQVLLDISSFYGNRIFLYFKELSGVITLFACLVALARMRQMNELTAVLSSGISLYRVAAPVIAFAIFTTGLWYADTELIIPSVAHKLARRHDDARGTRTYGVWFLPDRDGNLLSAQQYLPAENRLDRLLVLKRGPDGEIESVIQAEQANWEPDSNEPNKGRWRLERGIEHRQRHDTREGLAPAGDIENTLLGYYESDLDPRTIEVRQSANWIRFLSSARLNELAGELKGKMLEQVRETKHARFTTPLVNLLMLVLGLPFILDRLPGSILSSAGKCLLVCGACYLFNFAALNVGSVTDLSALPAWLPVLVFTPVAVVLMDRMHT